VSAVEVDWRADPQMPEFEYGSPADGNVWLHFFAQLPFDRPPGRRVETDGYADYNMTGIDAYAMYKSGDDWREIYNELFERYITVRPAIMKRAETLYSQEMRGPYCIGVDLRHAAHAVECPDPIPDIEIWIERVRALLPAPRTRLGRLKQRLMGETSWRVCLASDVESAVTAFRSEFGDRLVVQPGVVRVATHTDAEVHMVTQSEIALGEQGSSTACYPPAVRLPATRRL
jgi:hypothetical protein